MEPMKSQASDRRRTSTEGWSGSPAPKRKRTFGEMDVTRQVDEGINGTIWKGANPGRPVFAGALGISTRRDVITSIGILNSIFSANPMRKGSQKPSLPNQRTESTHKGRDWIREKKLERPVKLLP